MTDEPVIELRRIRKEYVLYRSAAARFVSQLFGRRSGERRFLALDDVSLRVSRAESVGIVGRNGAGKSTLLSVIAGVVSPSAGQVFVRGRIGALLALGAGFHPDFSGRDNVRLAAGLLGIGGRDLDAKFDQIAAFADIGDHLDLPVSTYSSGMFVRLAFAVHTVLEPDVLIVDEALAVGDAAFQAKCFRRLRDLRDRGATLLLVTHDTQTIRMFCQRAVWIDRGRVRLDGTPERVCDEYLRDLHGGDPAAVAGGVGRPAGPLNYTPPHGFAASVDLSDGGTPPAATRWGKGGARLLAVAISSSDGRQVATLEHGTRIRIDVVYRCDHPVPAQLGVAFSVLHRQSFPLLCEATGMQSIRLDLLPAGRAIRVEFEFDNWLAPDDYSLAVDVHIMRDARPEYLDFVSGILPFKVSATGPVFALLRPGATVTVIEIES